MADFRTRLEGSSRGRSRIILACDYPAAGACRVAGDIQSLSGHICAIKLNLHLLLPLGGGRISEINRTAHDCGLQSVADIKLNDIGNTNTAALGELWGMGFDAVIANPIMGAGSLAGVVRNSHENGCGTIALCHMSAPAAEGTYEMDVEYGGERLPLYRAFLGIASSCGADGIVVGATFPNIIRYCREARPDLAIFSPGVGVQGGTAAGAVSAGADYLIVGRTIIDSENPRLAAARLMDGVPLP